MLRNTSGYTEYICIFCGKKVKHSNAAGRPMPGNCPRKPKYAGGKLRPHTWRVNRKWD